MKINKLVILAFVLGFIIACVSLGVGWRYDIVPYVTCSADGKYVYMVDVDNFYKSEDFGNTWNTAPAETIKP